MPPGESRMGNTRTSVLYKLKNFIVGKIETFFYWYGYSIAKNPWKFIGGCLLLVAICCLGLLRFKHEKNPMNLWIPPESDFKKDTDWIIDKFQEGYRMQYFLITAPDVLQPNVIQQVEEIRRKVIAVSYDNATWEDVCFKIPAVKKPKFSFFDLFGRKKRSFFFLSKSDDDSVSGLPFDPSLFLSNGSYCSIVSKLPKMCLEVNLPQLWSNDDDSLSELTKENIIRTLNNTKVSPVYGHPMDFVKLLGDVVRDEDGKIIAAGSLLSVWMTHVNFTAVNMEEAGNNAGTAEWASGPTISWEKGYINLMEDVLLENSRLKNHSNISMYFEAGRSFSDISNDSMFQDMDKLFIGSLLMFCFIQFVLPYRFNWVELRYWLGIVGLMCIGLSFITTVSLCSLLGVPYGPVHTSLPFLLLGIGVDDIFVIISCWKNLSPSERKLKLQEQIATTLRHSGVSITVTSITDLVAFLVGSFTILPSLQSFCIYTAIGILIMYIFQATIFVAFLAIDEKRIQDGRNSILWCIKHDSFNRREFYKETTQAKVFHVIFNDFIFKIPVKILILLVTIGFTGIAIKGNLELRQKFDPQWFLPNSSYLVQFFNQRNKYYPDVGKDAGIFIGEIKYNEEINKIHELYLKFENETKIVKDVDSWTSGFIKYTNKAEGVDVLTDNVTEKDFSVYISRFLWSPNGARYQKNFRFNGELTCGHPAPQVTMSSIDFIFRKFNGPEEHIPAMNRLKSLVKEANFTTGNKRITIWSKIFATWVTDEVIDHELYRNLAMALACVMITTSILIVDFQICFWIFMCVFLTLVDVAGFMYFWGMYIDVATCIALVLAVGLCVDFAAHVGHTFLTFSGTKEERALSTVKYIGTATANGAFSTLLALMLLGNSDAYIFQTFFKIFFLVIVFGIFHGLVFLPVVLSLIGPESYEHERDLTKVTENEVISCKVVDGSDNVENCDKSDVKKEDKEDNHITR